MFSKWTELAEVSRQTYAEDEGGYKKSVYAKTGRSYPWHLKALSLSAVTDVSRFGREYRFHTAPDADIRESDRLEIGGVTYDVKGVALFSGITFGSKQILLSKSENAW